MRELIRRLEAAGLTVESTPGHYNVLRDGKPLRKANGMPSRSRSPPTPPAGAGLRSSTSQARHPPVARRQSSRGGSREACGRRSSPCLSQFPQEATGRRRAGWSGRRGLGHLRRSDLEGIQVSKPIFANRRVLTSRRFRIKPLDLTIRVRPRLCSRRGARGRRWSSRLRSCWMPASTGRLSWRLLFRDARPAVRLNVVLDTRFVLPARRNGRRSPCPRWCSLPVCRAPRSSCPPRRGWLPLDGGAACFLPFLERR